MTAHQNVDRQVTAWFDAQPIARPPEDLLARSLARVDATRQRPGWLVNGGWKVPSAARSGTFVPVWVVVAMIALLSLALIASGFRLILVTPPPLIVDSSPSASPSAERLDSIAPSTAVPTATPGPLGGGLILAHTLTQGRHNVVAFDAGTGERTLLGTVLGSEIEGSTYPHYTFQRNATGDRVLILGGDDRGLESPTEGSRVFGFFTPNDLNFACCTETFPDALVLSPRGDRVAFIAADRFDTPIEIVILDVSGGAFKTFPRPPGFESLGILSWAADESALVLSGCRPCNQATDPSQTQTPHHTHLYVVPLDGSAGHEQLDVDNGAVVGAWLTGKTLLTATWICPGETFMPRCDPAEALASLGTLTIATGVATDLVNLSGLFEFKVSPDGRRVAYRTNDGLWVLTVDGGTSLKVADGEAFEADWSPDGAWLLFRRAPFEVWIVPSAGGAARQVATDLSGAAWVPSPG